MASSTVPCQDTKQRGNRDWDEEKKEQKTDASPSLVHMKAIKASASLTMRHKCSQMKNEMEEAERRLTLKNRGDPS